MDPELISYFDQRFREVSLQNEGLRQEIKDLRGEMNHRFEQIDARFVKVEIRLDQIEERVEKIEIRLGQVEDRIEKVDDRVHQTQISVESLHADLRLVAEGVMSNDEKIVTLRKEVSRKLDDMGITIRQTYQDMGDRVRRVESYVKRESRDPIELIREKFGKQPGNS
ncbi:MAG TPA: hypothetical protein VH988_11785 [Thermoanaerobaculia bacterium]|jgi:uncharacterized coiled-coil protein SlyX|nr:hypothetical protein [Thermoanaerobaculia bacterium]